MSLMSFIGRERNLLTETSKHCHQLKLAHPVLTNEDMKYLMELERDDFFGTYGKFADCSRQPGRLSEAKGYRYVQGR